MCVSYDKNCMEDIGLIEISTIFGYITTFVCACLKAAYTTIPVTNIYALDQNNQSILQRVISCCSSIINPTVFRKYFEPAFHVKKVYANNIIIL